MQWKNQAVFPWLKQVNLLFLTVPEFPPSPAFNILVPRVLCGEGELCFSAVQLRCVLKLPASGADFVLVLRHQ